MVVVLLNGLHEVGVVLQSLFKDGFLWFELVVLVTFVSIPTLKLRLLDDYVPELVH